MKYVRVNNLKMAYEETGNGISIVFVHGFPLNRHLWEPQVNGLKEIARVITLDLPGHGDSESRSGSYLMDQVADDVYGFIIGLNINVPVVICGLSLGGYMLGQFFHKYGHCLAGLIFTATRASPDSAETMLNRNRLIALARQSGTHAVIEDVLYKFFSPRTNQSRPELVAHVREIMQKTSLDGMVGDLIGMRERPDTHELLKQINVPALIIHGTDDQLIPIVEGKRIKDTIQNARMSIIPDAGHLPNLEQPELFNQAVTDFIRSVYS